MLPSADEIIARLRRLAEPVSAPAGSSPERIVLAEVLVRVARCWEDATPELSKSDLEALCRKLCVTKTLKEFYGSGWRKDPSAPALPASLWPLVIAVLLAYSVESEGAEQEERGTALKCLNASLVAIDVAGTSVTEELRSWSTARVDAVKIEGRP